MSRTWTIPGEEAGSGFTRIHCVLNTKPIRVIMTGEVDLLAKPALDAVLRTIAPRAGADVVVDLRPATVLSCVGVGFVYSLAEQLAQWNGTVYVQVLAGRVARILELLGVDEAVTILYNSMPG
jgi:anti-anti-sigma factor